MIEFPDLNVLIPLFDPKHIHHDRAQNWFDGLSADGWATCPYTENGLIRIVSSPTYPDIQLSYHDVGDGLSNLISSSKVKHHLFAETVLLRDTAIFNLAMVKGHKQLPDIYLLGLCQAHKAMLVTFDTAIPTMLPCIVNPIPNLVRLLP